MTEVYCFALRNDPAALGGLMTWIDELVPVLGLSPKTTYALQLCLEEVVVNIVSYAFEPDTTHDVHVALWRDGAGIVAEVTDDGRPFDPLSHQESEPAKDLASAQIGGLGIRLVRSFASSIVYQRVGSLNRLTLSFAADEAMEAS